ncbi:recombinase family protein, partial [Enterovibrio nigricans]
MFIRAYLRASTDEQNADRAKTTLEQFISEHGQRIASYYTENISGTQLERPELNRRGCCKKSVVIQNRLISPWRITDRWPTTNSNG